jgi:hypothetical protein
VSVTDLEERFATLLAPLSAQDRETVLWVLANDRLEHGEPTPDQVQLLVRSITEDMDDATYLAAVMARVNNTSADL